MTEHKKVEWYGNEHSLPDGSYIDKDGDVCYIKNGKLHRDNWSAVEYYSGRKEWWVNGKLHRENGPAIEYVDGTKKWYINGKRHREDGPAIEYADGGKEWWVNGESYIEEEYEKALKIWKMNEVMK